jgi:hypothetical protein
MRHDKKLKDLILKDEEWDMIGDIVKFLDVTSNPISSI